MTNRVNRFRREFDEAFPPKDYEVLPPPPHPDVPYSPPEAPLWKRILIAVLFILALVAMVRWPW